MVHAAGHQHTRSEGELLHPAPSPNPAPVPVLDLSLQGSHSQKQQQGLVCRPQGSRTATLPSFPHEARGSAAGSDAVTMSGYGHHVRIRSSTQ